MQYHLTLYPSFFNLAKVLIVKSCPFSLLNLPTVSIFIPLNKSSNPFSFLLIFLINLQDIILKNASTLLFKAGIKFINFSFPSSETIKILLNFL